MDHPDHVNGKYLPKLRSIQVLVMDISIYFEHFEHAQCQIIFYEILHQLVITQFIDFLQIWRTKLAVWLAF